MIITARNARTNGLLGASVRRATGRIDRVIGLIGRRQLAPGEALWILPSRGVHTCGMRFPIDVIALDESGRVVDVAPAMKPWRLRLPRAATAGVLEVAAGIIARTGTQLGDQIVFEVGDACH